MSINYDDLEQEEDFEDILRCSYEKAGVVGHGRKKEEENEFEEDEFEDEFDDILRCSYEPGYENKTASHYRKEEGGMGDDDGGKVMDDAFYYRHEPATTATAAVTQHQQDVIVASAPRLLSQLGENNNIDPLNVSKKKSQQQQQQQHQHQTIKPKRKSQSSHSRRFSDQSSMLSHIHLYSQGGSVVSSLPNYDIIYNHAHSSEVMRCNAHDVMEGNVVGNNIMEDGGDGEGNHSAERTKKKKGRSKKATGSSSQQQKRATSVGEDNTPPHSNGVSPRSSILPSDSAAAANSNNTNDNYDGAMMKTTSVARKNSSNANVNGKQHGKQKGPSLDQKETLTTKRIPEQEEEAAHDEHDSTGNSNGKQRKNKEPRSDQKESPAMASRNSSSANKSSSGNNNTKGKQSKNKEPKEQQQETPVTTKMPQEEEEESSSTTHNNENDSGGNKTPLYAAILARQKGQRSQSSSSFTSSKSSKGRAKNENSKGTRVNTATNSKASSHYLPAAVRSAVPPVSSIVHCNALGRSMTSSITHNSHGYYDIPKKTICSTDNIAEEGRVLADGKNHSCGNTSDSDDSPRVNLHNSPAQQQDEIRRNIKHLPSEKPRNPQDGSTSEETSTVSIANPLAKSLDVVSPINPLASGANTTNNNNNGDASSSRITSVTFREEESTIDEHDIMEAIREVNYAPISCCNNKGGGNERIEYDDAEASMEVNDTPRKSNVLPPHSAPRIPPSSLVDEAKQQIDTSAVTPHVNNPISPVSPITEKSQSSSHNNHSHTNNNKTISKERSRRKESSPLNHSDNNIRTISKEQWERSKRKSRTLSCDPRNNSKGSSKEGLDSSQKTAVISNRKHIIPQPMSSALSSANTDGSSIGSTPSNNSSHDTFSLSTAVSASPSIPSGSSEPMQYNGWNVPLGVHKVICSSPGLRVTTQIHRRSVPIKIMTRRVDTVVEEDLIIPPESYVDILETRVHGERVRGRICWEMEEEEEEEEDSTQGSKNKRPLKGMLLKKQTASSRIMLLKKQTPSRFKSKRNNKTSTEEEESALLRKVVKKYEGWISLQWATDNSKEKKDNATELVENEGSEDNEKGLIAKVATDENSGPWTEPVPLGVYRINFGDGLPLLETPERDSAVLSKLHRGRCVEVVQTQVTGDRVVRARVIVPQSQDNEDVNKLVKFTSGWISLLNAGASPVPLGAYVVVADEPGCVITEGGRLDSKVKGTSVPGSCMEVVSTRMEEGVVRGLIASGGHVTLFVPPRTNHVSFDDGTNGGGSGRIKADNGGQMFGMPVPLGTYQIIQDALTVTISIASNSSLVTRLGLNATVEIIETHVEDRSGDGSRVRGLLLVKNEDNNGSRPPSSGAMISGGWITLFEVRRNRMRMYAHPKQQK